MYVKRPKAMLFDWDNTLVNTFPIIYKALNITFETMGHEPWTFDEVKNGREGIHHSLRQSFPRIFGEDKWEKAKQVYFDAFLDIHLDEIEKLPDVEQTLLMLDELKKQGVFVGIVSNKTGKYLREEVDHMGWNHRFDAIIGATDAVRDKPFADPIFFALQGKNIEEFGDVWMVGDSATDLEAGLNAGCLPVYFGDGEFPDQYHSDARVKVKIPHVENHNELQTLIQAIK